MPVIGARYLVVIGPDGSGKTSVADRLAEILSEDIPVRRMNFSFGRLPSLSAVLGRPPRRAAPEGQRGAGMVQPLSAGRALLLGIWYGIDHVLGHLTLRRAQPGELIVFARSYHDFLYQRAYMNMPRFVIRIFLALGPAPVLAVTPMRAPKAIHEAKPELTELEIAEQYTRIIRALNRYSYFACIDASAGVEETVRSVREKLPL